MSDDDHFHIPWQLGKRGCYSKVLMTNVNNRMTDLKKKLESIYLKYNQRKYVDPDPLLFLYNYREKKNREIAGLIAACFAYGRVEQIMKIVARVLDKLGPCPFDYLMEMRKKDIENDFKNFQYRFAKDVHLINLLWGMEF
jgi:hypothetical protein